MIYRPTELAVSHLLTWEARDPDHMEFVLPISPEADGIIRLGAERKYLFSFYMNNTSKLLTARYLIRDRSLELPHRTEIQRIPTGSAVTGLLLKSDTPKIIVSQETGPQIILDSDGNFIFMLNRTDILRPVTPGPRPDSWLFNIEQLAAQRPA